MNSILAGKLVRLAAFDPEANSKSNARWWRDSEFSRLLDSYLSPLKSQKALQTGTEEMLAEEEAGNYWFSIRALADDRLIGDIDLSVITWAGREAFIGLGIGERDYWGRGYGTPRFGTMGIL